MNRLAVDAGAVSLAQGFPDFPARRRSSRRRPPRRSSPTSTSTRSRGAPGRSARPSPRRPPGSTPAGTPTPRRDITVVCGATEGMIAAMLGLLDPGDEVDRLRAVLRELRSGRDPVGRDPALRHAPRAGLVDRSGRAAGGRRAADAGDRRQLAPQPDRQGLQPRRARADRRRSAVEHDLLAFTDDIYEHIVYAGEHIPLATMPGMADRTVSINSMSKTYSVTGWRVGWVIAAADSERRRSGGPTTS